MIGSDSSVTSTPTQGPVFRPIDLMCRPFLSPVLDYLLIGGALSLPFVLFAWWNPEFLPQDPRTRLTLFLMFNAAHFAASTVRAVHEAWGRDGVARARLWAAGRRPSCRYRLRRVARAGRSPSVRPVSDLVSVSLLGTSIRSRRDVLPSLRLQSRSCREAIAVLDCHGAFLESVLERPRIWTSLDSSRVLACPIWRCGHATGTGLDSDAALRRVAARITRVDGAVRNVPPRISWTAG